MNNDDERDYAEESYWRDRCPNCDEKHDRSVNCDETDKMSYQEAVDIATGN